MDVQRIIRRMAANAGVFEALCSDVSQRQARWKPSPQAWSILEVANHLADEEADDFRTRIDYTLHRPGEAWPPIDPEAWARDRRYNDGSLAPTLARFLAERRHSVAWLADLGDADWSLQAEHPTLGPMTAGQLLTSWLAHDFIHIRQINRIHREYLVAELSHEPADYAGRW